MAAAPSDPRFTSREAPAPGQALPADTARATAQLYDRHATLVYRFAYQMLQSREDAEDATQATFMAAHTAIAGGTTVREPQAWLVRICRNQCLARIEQRMRRPLTQQLDDPTLAQPSAPGPSVHEQVALRGQLDAASETLSRLPETQRDAFVLREFLGMTISEVATTLDTTIPAVDALLNRARRELIRSVAGEEKTASCRETRDALSAGLIDRASRAHLVRCRGCRAARRALLPENAAISLRSLVPPVIIAQRLADQLDGFGGQAAGSAAAGGGIAAVAAKLAATPAAFKAAAAALTAAAAVSGGVAAVSVLHPQVTHLSQPAHATRTHHTTTATHVNGSGGGGGRVAASGSRSSSLPVSYTPPDSTPTDHHKGGTHRSDRSHAQNDGSGGGGGDRTPHAVASDGSGSGSQTGDRGSGSGGGKSTDGSPPGGHHHHSGGGGGSYGGGDGASNPVQQYSDGNPSHSSDGSGQGAIGSPTNGSSPPTGTQPPTSTQLPTGTQPPPSTQPPTATQPPTGTQPPASTDS
jgi:RNA polymerase sigma factor (sigma-70 family)